MSSAFCRTSCSTQSPTAMRLSMGSKGGHYIYPPPPTHTHTHPHTHPTSPPSFLGVFYFSYCHLPTSVVDGSRSKVSGKGNTKENLGKPNGSNEVLTPRSISSIKPRARWATDEETRDRAACTHVHLDGPGSRGGRWRQRRWGRVGRWSVGGRWGRGRVGGRRSFVVDTADRGRERGTGENITERLGLDQSII